MGVRRTHQVVPEEPEHACGGDLQPEAGERRGPSAKELATPAAADHREEHSGRYMVELEGVGLTHYIETDFGKMEYWLDRPELPAGPI